jgi:transcriptional regulator with XRE-family HTH domain
MPKRRSVKIENLPAKLRAARKHLGLSQSQLARRLSFDVHYNRISEYERGRRTPNLLLLLDYARLAGIHIDDLVDDQIELNF